jgi:hypothetical protein
VLGQSASVLSGTLAFTTTTTASSPAGTYAGAVTPSGLTSTNYAITFAVGNMVVTAAPLAITGSGAQVYGGANRAFSASYSGFVLGQTASVLGGTLAFTTTTAASSPAGTYLGAVTPSGLTSSNYAITFVPGNMLVTAAPLTITGSGTQPDYAINYVNGTLTVITPPAMVESVAIQTRRIGTKKTKVIVLQFNEAMNPSDAQSTATYTLATIAKTRKQKQKPVALAQEIYSATGTSFSVMLVTRKSLTLSQPLELTINAEALLDALGQPLDGNDSGQSGANFVATLTKTGVTVNSVAPVSAGPQLSASAVDVLLGEGFRLRSRRV